MVTTADKTTKVATVTKQASGTTFFRKAGEESFFGSSEKQSFFPAKVQAKLSVSTPDDPQEKEADAVADKVMRMPETSVAIEAPRENLQKKEDEDIQTKREAASSQIVVQRKPVSENISQPVVHRKQAMGMDTLISRQAERGPPQEGSSFTQTLEASKGSGSALSGETQNFMESRFGADFSGVRVHTGPTAQNLSRSINAQAFAHGGDIYFNSGKYSPGSTEGKTLLAHELTHTIQQGASKPLSRKVITANTAVAGIAGPTRGSPSGINSKPALSRSTVQPNGKLHLSSDKPEKEIKRKEDGREKLLSRKENSDLTVSHDRRPLTDRPVAIAARVATIPAVISPVSSASVSTAVSPAVTTTTGRGPPLARSIQPSNKSIVQRAIYDAALGRVGEFLSDIPLTVDIDEAKRWLIGGVRRFASYIPGYRALGVVLGHDPISGEEIASNGRNFIEAGLDIIPGGNLIKQKLEETGLLEQAAQWIDTQIAAVTSMVNGVRGEFTTAWNALGITSILDGPTAILRNLGGILERAINNIIDFARRTATELIEMVKRFLLNEVVGFVKQHTNAYELLKVIIGKDPITDETVLPNGTNILNALLEMGGDAGREQRRQMQETHSFEKAAGWIDRGIGVFGDLYTAVRGGFKRIWDFVSIDALMHPINTFNQIYEIFAGPVARVMAFVNDALAAILGFIKEALMSRLSTWARTIRGFPLVTVLLGKDPFTNASVPRTVENIIRGFMSLMEGGEEQFNQLQQSGAIARTMARINAAVARLNMTPEYVIQLFIDLWNSFSFTDLANPIAAFERIMAKFGEPIRRLFAFIIEIIRIVVEVVLQIMNFPTDLIANIIAKAMQAFEMIKRNPVGFLKNLLSAIKKGFQQFFGNIGRHLLAGLQAWLMSELRDSGVRAPQDFSLRGIIGWVLELLGISMEKIWEKLAAHPRIGPEKVARIRGMIDRLDGIWTFIKDVQQRGIAAIWEKIQEKLSSLWDTLLDAIKNWIMEQIVDRVTARLLSMLDPTGIMAAINAAIALYRAIQTFVRYLRQMLEIVNSFVEGVVEIASGNISTAANFLERSMARGVPIMIGFLANQVGLGGLGRRIGEMVGRVRALVDQALTWLVNKAVTMGMNLLDRVLSLGRSAVGAARDLAARALAGVTRWFSNRKEFATASGERHRLYYRGQEDSAELIMESNPIMYTAFLSGIRIEATDEKQAEKTAAKTQALRIAAELETIKRRNVEGANDAETRNNEQQKHRDAAAKLDELIPHTRILLDVALPMCGEPVHVPASASNSSFGVMATLKPLTKRGFSISHGSPPTDNAHAVYDKLALRRQGRIPYYKKGHLMNQQFKGQGSWNNLTPLTTAANGTHEGSVESMVKAAVDTGAIVEYTVRPVYPGRRSDRVALKERMRTENVPSLDIKHQIVDAEDNVPTALDCNAWRLNEALARVDRFVQIIIPNNIARQPADYEVDGESHFSQVLVDFSVDMVSKMTYVGIPLPLANLIVRTRSITGPFLRYQQMADAVTAGVVDPQLKQSYHNIIMGFQNNDRYRIRPN